jgi:hypothetical protein
MQQDSNEHAQRLAAKVELRLAGHSSGHLSVGELREGLLALVNVSPQRIDFGSVPEEPIRYFQDNKLMEAVLPIFMTEAPTQKGPQSLVYPASAFVGT